MPLIFVTALALQGGSPNDVAFGRYVRESGLAIPLVLLLFSSVWLFPLVTALVAGDIIAAEDHNGTLKTILTRSLDRGQIFAGKLLAAATYAALALVLMGSVAVVAGSLKSGFNGLISLSGTHVAAGHALGLVAASFAVYMIPVAAVVCVGLLLSALTRNSAAAVVGTLMFALLMQLIGILPGLSGTDPYLLTRSSRPGRASSGRPPTGTRSSARCGCARSTPYRPGSAPTWCSCGATSPAAERATTGSDPDVASVGFGCGS